MKNKKYLTSFVILFFIFAGGGCSYDILNKNSNKTNSLNIAPAQIKQDDKNSYNTSTLNLSYQNFNKVPEYVFSLVTLLELDLSNNSLVGAIPAEIGHLKKLKTLNLSNNQMTGVPAEVGQLYDLEVLNLANNKLTGLPYELGNLKKLRVLDLRGNNYAVADLNIIKKGLNSSVEIKL